MNCQKLGMQREFAKGCAMGKAYREFFGKEKTWKASVPLELIHSDVYGPMQSTTIGGN